MRTFAIMVLRENEDPHPRYEILISADDKQQALKRAVLYMEAWELQGVAKIRGIRYMSEAEKKERLDDTLHYLAEGYKKYQEQQNEME